MSFALGIADNQLSRIKQFEVIQKLKIKSRKDISGQYMIN